ncbi:MAG: radical SAM protein [Nitrospina sp.]|jgi:7-carboxy-7-deazaguanine synthase|nr:radical SAM protein [Nitrospina sp.]MBT3414044.1 radical SAM protein [Nitrospina sp.]MBT3858098.1 radical SAM protein [Nitrospina sp.]MBT4104533.1 radical SAM protein [Nitrospina sp.]MBT4389898.1 radical SAM protein [Nitrospina sp.]
MLKINEIYASIQGESSHTGLPCVFIRLTGCNLRCSWCDTAYAFYEGNDLTIEETLQKVETFGLGLVEITGGEPLLQEDVYPLMEALLKKGYRVMLETGGALPIDKVPEKVIKILDVKCPGSGEEKKNHLENLKLLSPHDEVKFVLLDRTDYEWSRDLLQKHDLPTQVLFSPVYDKLNLKDLVQWILEDRLPVRLQTQLHKVIWSKDTIGV